MAGANNTLPPPPVLIGRHDPCHMNDVMALRINMVRMWNVYFVQRVSCKQMKEQCYNSIREASNLLSTWHSLSFKPILASSRVIF